MLTFMLDRTWMKIARKQYSIRTKIKDKPQLALKYIHITITYICKMVLRIVLQQRAQELSKEFFVLLRYVRT